MAFIRPSTAKAYAKARSAGYRSGLEVKVATDLTDRGFPVEYEAHVLRYVVPEYRARYTPDFLMRWNGIVVETKGVFAAADRQKHLLVKNDHPDLDIRFVFTNPLARIAKASATTYAAWCDKHGFLYAKGLIPPEWINEPPQSARLAAMRAALGIA